jgi:DNA-binding IclR family transcriptional regulator
VKQRVNAAPQAASRTGIQSVEMTAPLLKAFCDSDAPLPLTVLASHAGMPRSQAHKYLTSLVRMGLAAQAGQGKPYSLGPLALELGLTALRRLDVVEKAQNILDELRDRVKTTASLAIWGNRGPTIVRWAEMPELISPTVRLGTVFPVLTSVLGHVFIAYLDGRDTRALIQSELSASGSTAKRSGIRTAADVSKLIDAVRKKGCASGNSIVAPGVAAIAAPVLDHAGCIVAAIACAGLSGRFDLRENALPTRAVIDAAQSLSRQLGADPRK